MYFSIIRKWVLRLALLTALMAMCARHSHAAVIGFLGGETGDTHECPNTSIANATLAADNTFANSGGWSYKITTTNNTTPHADCFFTPASPPASATIDESITLNFVPNSVGSNTLALMLMDSGANTSLAEVFLNTTAGGAASLQFWNTQAGTQIGTPFTVTVGVTYRVVFEATIGASGRYILLVCTVPANSCTTVGDTGAGGINTGTGTGWVDIDPMFVQDNSNLNSNQGLTMHIDDVLITNSFGDPGPHEVLARQFAAAGTYTGWSASGGGGCPANWDQTPVNISGPFCTNSTTGAATCAAGATACGTGTTHFDVTGGTGSTGFGSQTIATTQTINAVKIGGWGTTADSNAVSSVFITSGAAETDTVFPAAFGGVNTYQEAYLASVPSATNLIGAQAGVKHATTGTAVDSVNTLWLMADVALPAAAAGQGNVIILGDLSASRNQLLALDLSLQP